MTKDNIKEKYIILHDEKDKTRWMVKLSSECGDWSGIIYSYGRFEIKEPDVEGGSAKFCFERDILFVPEELRGKDFPDERNIEFTTLLGKILYDILEDNLDKASDKDGKLVLELSKND